MGTPGDVDPRGDWTDCTTHSLFKRPPRVLEPPSSLTLPGEPPLSLPHLVAPLRLLQPALQSSAPAAVSMAKGGNACGGNDEEPLRTCPSFDELIREIDLLAPVTSAPASAVAPASVPLATPTSIPLPPAPPPCVCGCPNRLTPLGHVDISSARAPHLVPAPPPPIPSASITALTLLAAPPPPPDFSEPRTLSPLELAAPPPSQSPPPPLSSASSADTETSSCHGSPVDSPVQAPPPAPLPVPALLLPASAAPPGASASGRPPHLSSHGPAVSPLPSLSPRSAQLPPPAGSPSRLASALTQAGPPAMATTAAAPLVSTTTSLFVRLPPNPVPFAPPPLFAGAPPNPPQDMARHKFVPMPARLFNGARVGDGDVGNDEEEGGDGGAAVGGTSELQAGAGPEGVIPDLWATQSLLYNYTLRCMTRGGLCVAFDTRVGRVYGAGEQGREHDCIISGLRKLLARHIQRHKFWLTRCSTLSDFIRPPNFLPSFPSACLIHGRCAGPWLLPEQRGHLPRPLPSQEVHLPRPLHALRAIASRTPRVD